MEAWKDGPHRLKRRLRYPSVLVLDAMRDLRDGRWLSTNASGILPETRIYSTGSQLSTLIKNKIKFSSYIGKFRVEQLQSHTRGRAFLYMRKCENISPYMRRPLVIYDFATAPL